MARLIGFFALVWVLSSLLGILPGVGNWFGGFFTFWIAAAILSVALTRLSFLLTGRRRLADQVRNLGNVETPHNQGKLGALQLSHGRAARAIAPLERAVQGEPQVAEWSYRLGCALLARGRAPEAIAAFERAAAIDEEYAYGGLQLALARARSTCGDHAGALAALERFERNHGANPESAYRRGVALRKLGRAEEARASFGQVRELARRAARYQSNRNRAWVLRALVARLG